MRELKLSVPTYYGTASKGNIVGNDEFDEPDVSVLVHEADGVRIVLGTHDFEKGDKPDIQIDRRPKGWAIFLHPSAGDPCGCVYLLDDGRSFLLRERPWSSEGSIQILEDDAPTDLDDIDLPLPDVSLPACTNLVGSDARDAGTVQRVDSDEVPDRSTKERCARCGQREDDSEDWYDYLCPSCADETDCDWVCRVCGRSGTFEAMGGDGADNPACCETPCERCADDDAPE